LNQINSIQRSDFLDFVERFRQAHVLVIGAAVAEIDVQCDVKRLAPDRVMPVYQCDHQTIHPGGAALCASTIRNLGGQVTLLSNLGATGAGQALRRALADDGIGVVGRAVETTPELWRYLSTNGSRQMLQIRRFWNGRTIDLDGTSIDKFLGDSHQSAHISAVLIVDAQPACLSHSTVEQVAKWAHSRGLPVVFDSAGGECPLQPHLVHDLIVNESELAQIARDSGAVVSAESETNARDLARAASTRILLSRGRQAAILIGGGSPEQDAVIPVVPRPFTDRRGVGFVLSGVYSLGLAAGVPARDAAFLACGAASSAAATPGPKHLTIDDLHHLAFREIESDVADAIELFQRIGREMLPVIDSAARLLLQAYTRDRQVLVFGNGGSAAEANHLVGELTGRFKASRPGLPAISLSANDSLTTCLANDYGYEDVFARQVDTFCREGDVVIGLSTSGKSSNVVKAMEAARARGAKIIALTGSVRGPMSELADVSINVPSRITARIQEAHLFVIHVMCDMLDRRLDPTGRLHPAASEM